MVKTDWFSYASGNDVAAPTKMINEIECCLKNGKKICYSNFYHTDKDLKVTRTTDFYKYDYKVHLKGNFVNDCATIHKSILDKYMPFDITWKNHAYWDFWLRVYEGEGDVFCFNPNPEWYYRVSKNSKHIQRSRNPEKIKQNKKMKYKMLQSHAER
jgi:ribosomal protein L24E